LFFFPQRYTSSADDEQSTTKVFIDAMNEESKTAAEPIFENLVAEPEGEL